jgi:hypothetical protein
MTIQKVQEHYFHAVKTGSADGASDYVVITHDANVRGRALVVGRFIGKDASRQAHQHALTLNRAFARIAGCLPDFLVSFNINVERLTPLDVL